VAVQRHDRTSLGGAPPGGLLVATAIAAVLSAAYLVLRPAAPDLPAQLARAGAASRGVQLWWAGWYGGINTSTYSLISAHLMSLVGVGAVGVLSTLIVTLAAADLVKTSQRPRAGAAAVAIAAGANLYSGRITFAAGMALALLSFCLLRRGRLWPAIAMALATGLVSPLAALCQCIGVAALLLTRRDRRPAHLLLGIAGGAPVLTITVLFGQPSYMPFSADTCLFALLACAGVLIAPVPRLVRALALVSAALAIAAVAVHSPIGSNAARMPMLAAAPLVIATARPSHRRVSVLALGLLAWPAISFTSDMAIAAQPSSQAAFYAPLLAQLPRSGQARQRVEVLDPRTHAAAYYLSTQVPVARGWERQIDAAQNRLFYKGSLTASTYGAWLSAQAVGWVAVPSAHLDYSAVQEQRLVLSGLPYLRLIWSSPQWRLYRVTEPARMALGALHVTAATDTEIRLDATSAGWALVRTQYSRLLVVRSLTDPAVTGCVAPADNGQVLLSVPSPGGYSLHAEVGALSGHCLPQTAASPRTARW
jgi:hypothetical protein